MTYVSFKRHLLVSALLVLASMGIRAQEASRGLAPGATSSVPAIVAEPNRQPAPQVVTVVHRLSGIKLLRLLRHSDAQASGVNALDDRFLTTKDLHTSFIAGLALDDGRTIVSWLPQAEAEVETASWQATAAPDLADLMIVQRDGQQFAARYVGLDGLTGLSLLQVGGLTLPVLREAVENKLYVGQRVRLLAPQRVEQVGPKTIGTVYLRVGEIQCKLTEITRVSSGRIARLTARAANLSPAIVGGVALNEAGETIGIVETSDEHEARIMPVALVRRAAERVLARHASVPRPWLGVSGEAVSTLSLENFRAMGWPVAPAMTLLNKRRGILLSSVAPGTPAALAKLRPGDLILRANEMELRSAEDLTFMLSEAGAGASVKFTLLRPDQPSPLAVNITLSESLSPVRAMEMSATGAAPRLMVDPLVAHGAETLALSPQAAARFGASGGLLVVFVKPESAAASSGLRTGDVIESVNGQTPGNSLFVFPTQPAANLSLGIVRNRQKLLLNLRIENSDRQK